MMTDLDNALLYTEKLLAMNMPRENLAALRKVLGAARLVANGIEVRWCETHEASGAEKCWAFVYGNAANDPLDANCRMVGRTLIASPGTTDE